MLTVEDYEQVRKAVLVEGLSQRAAARQFQHGRETVKKALRQGAPPGYQRTKELKCPQLDIVRTIIDGWVEDERERHVPRKQRSNATELWKRLCRDHGFKGSVYVVRRYLQRRREQAGGEVFFPLDFRPGAEAQVDWGEAWVQLGGELVPVQLFCMRLCYSRATYVRAYPAEKMECFLDGHVRAFRHFGGVPRCNAYDNLKTAVIWVGRAQERKLNKTFIHLRSHYLFESRFCNVASGHEKGRVENLVKLAQGSFLAGVPTFTDLTALNVYLETCCREDLERLAPQSERKRGELYKEDQAQLLPIRNGDFDACVLQSTMASKQALVQYETNFYSVPVRYAHHRLLLKAYADRVELWPEGQCASRHERSWARHQFVLNYRHYIPLLETKPGGIHHGRPFQGEPWGADLERLRTELVYRYEGEGLRKFVKVLLLFTGYPEAQVKGAVGECVRRRAFSDEAVESVLRYRPPQEGRSLNLSAHPHLQLETDGVRRATEYDEVLLTREASA
jgi:transposase